VDVNISLPIISLTILLILSGLFSGSETAIFSLSKLRLRRLQAKHPKVFVVVQELLKHPKRTLNSILIGNMLVNITASGLVASMAIKRFGQAGVGIAVGMLTFLLLVFGELAPKTFAIRNAQAFAVLIARPLFIFSKAIFPLRWLLKVITDLFYSMIMGKKPSSQPFVTQRELRTLVSIGEKEGILDKDEKRMIHAVFDFSKRGIDEILTPRVDIVAVEKGVSCSELIHVMEKSKHNRIPVYEGTIDNIRGVVYMKDAVLNPKQNWHGYIKPVLFVPETKRIDDLLVEFQSKKIYIAIVVDEYGGTSGLVSAEDILEEIVGEIRDEYDKAEGRVTRIDRNTFSIDASLSLYDINEELKLGLKTEEAETLGGYLLGLFEKIPSAGENIKHGRLTFRIDEVEQNRIKKVTITRSSR